jgi:hypothetical protein
VGAGGVQAAWLLARHADHDRPFRRRRPDLPRAAVQKGEVAGAQLAYLTDRLRVADKRKQVYGTQLVVGSRPEPAPIEDEASVDRRRREVGLSPLAEYLRGFEQALQGQAVNLRASSGGGWLTAGRMGPFPELISRPRQHFGPEDRHKATKKFPPRRRPPDG